VTDGREKLRGEGRKRRSDNLPRAYEREARKARKRLNLALPHFRINEARGRQRVRWTRHERREGWIALPSFDGASTQEKQGSLKNKWTSGGLRSVLMQRGHRGEDAPVSNHTTYDEKLRR
jgi:hypothetical protein